uniref:Uncharacterized protein n=1 Tax=Panagrellus redivivus TaxID=6233 RepID=A0A7E4WAE9_PANRE
MMLINARHQQTVQIHDTNRKTSKQIHVTELVSVQRGPVGIRAALFLLNCKNLVSCLVRVIILTCVFQIYPCVVLHHAIAGPYTKWHTID